MKHLTKPRPNRGAQNQVPLPGMEQNAKSESSETRTINALRKNLSEEDQADFDRLLNDIPAEFSRFKTDRHEVGSKLAALRDLFAKAGRNGKFNRCLSLMHVPKSTAYDVIADYEFIEGLPSLLRTAAEEEGIDLASASIRRRVQQLEYDAKKLTSKDAKALIQSLKLKSKRSTNARFGAGITEEDKNTYQVYVAMKRSTDKFDNPKDKRPPIQRALNWLAKYDGFPAGEFKITPQKAADDWILEPAQGKKKEEEKATGVAA